MIGDTGYGILYLKRRGCKIRSIPYASKIREKLKNVNLRQIEQVQQTTYHQAWLFYETSKVVSSLRYAFTSIWIYGMHNILAHRVDISITTLMPQTRQYSPGVFFRAILLLCCFIIPPANWARHKGLIYWGQQSTTKGEHHERSFDTSDVQKSYFYQRLDLHSVVLKYSLQSNSLLHFTVRLYFLAYRLLSLSA